MYHKKNVLVPPAEKSGWKAKHIFALLLQRGECSWNSKLIMLQF